jgi:hypothetical protein
MKKKKVVNVKIKKVENGNTVTVPFDSSLINVLRSEGYSEDEIEAAILNNSIPDDFN